MTESHRRRQFVNRRGRRSMSAHHDRWMISYADFMTLLFAFFTTMYATSNVDREKLNTLVASMQKAFVNNPSGKAGQGAVSPGAIVIPPSAIPPHEAGGELQHQLKERLDQELKDDRLSVDVDGRGVVISLHESGSFSLGSADLTPEAREVLSKIATTLAHVDAAVRVEGHTDDVPIRTPRYASNWDLSAARAINVMQYLASAGGLDSSRLSVSGYAEFHPKVPNDSPEDRAQNRRVDLVILNSETRASEEPRATRPQAPEASNGQGR